MNHSSSYRLAAKVLVSSIFICLVAPLVAQNDNPTGKSGVFNGNSDVGASYDPYTANATRTIVDLTVPGAVGNYPLQWTRTMNTRRTEGPSYGLGSGGAWRHSYGWDIDWETENGRPFSSTPRPKSYIVYYPDGRRVAFQRRASVPIDSLWRGPAGVTDRFQPVAGTGYCYLLLSDGGKVEFYQTGVLDPELGWEFNLYPVNIIDPYGQKTIFTYSSAGLSQITEPAGRWLRINYITAFGSQVIGSVQAGYGSNTVTQSVSYSYQQFTAGSFNYTTLTGATYSDGTSAAYTYQADNTYPHTGPPLIRTCDDVRYPGPMKTIAYEFISSPSEGSGGIYGEFTRARKWLPPAPPVVDYVLFNHQEQRGDGPTRTFYYSSAVPLQTKPLPYLLRSYTDFQGKLTSLGYDTNTYLNSVTDANGNTTTFTKTPLTGKILTVTHPPDANGVQSTKEYVYTNQNTAYYLDHVIDELRNKTTYQRDDKFRIKTINYPDTATEEFTYHPTFGLVVTHKMTSGGTEAFEYDSRGRLLRYRDPFHDPINKTGKPTTWYQYDPLDRVSGATDWRGTGPGDLNYTTNYEYNQRGQLTKRIHPIDSVTGARYSAENTYNNDGTLATVTDERGSTTTYGYDDYKRLSSITAPPAYVGDTTPRTTYLYYDKTGGTSIDYRYTASSVGNVTTPLGNTVKTLYDNNFWKSSVIAGTGWEAATTTYTYDAVGNLKTMTDPNGQSTCASTEYFYDKRSRLTDINDPIALDRNSLGHTVSWTYDQIGNKKSQQRANNQLITYDAYDAMHRLQVQSVQHDGNVSDRTVMTYDLAGNLETFIDARQKQYTYEYDLLNRKTKTIYPADDAGTIHEEHYHYDLANNMDTFTDRSGAVQTFQYDNRNRQTHFSWNTWPLNSMHERWLSYDPVGNILQVRTSGYDVSDFSYDFRNRKKSETQTWGLNYPARTVGYTYDADSNRKTITYPSGSTFTYYYTSRNEVLSIREGGSDAVNYSYDKSGNRRTRTLSNGTSTIYYPDALNRPQAIQHRRGATEFGRFDYMYDTVSRVDSVKRDSFRGDKYDYYLDDQLKTAQFNALNPDSTPNSAANTTSLVYDGNGNRTSQDNATSPDYTYTANDLNQYNSVNGSTPTYDANGNLSSYNGSNYGYNKQNQLSVVEGGANSLYFYYDGLGRQILRYQGGQWIYSVWDGWDLIEEYRQSDFAFTHSYVHGAATDEMVQRFDTGTGSNRIWYYQDAQGSTTHLADDAGNIVEKYMYPPADSGRPVITDFFGQPRSVSAFGNRFMYTGREYYPERAIYDYRNRFYLPSFGRFLQADPIGFAGGDANLYRYCGNDPINNVDPSGLVNWRTVARGTLTTVGGVATIYGGAAVAGTTWQTGYGAWVGGTAMFVGATSTGLGLTTIADGFRDNSNSPANIPQGPLALTGQMTGNPQLEEFGGMLDVMSAFYLPPAWGGPLGLANTVLFSPLPSGNFTGGGETNSFGGSYHGPPLFTAGFHTFYRDPVGGFRVIDENGSTYYPPLDGGASSPSYGDNTGTFTFGPYNSATSTAAAWEASWGGGSNWLTYKLN